MDHCPFAAWNTRNFKLEYLVEWKAPLVHLVSHQENRFFHSNGKRSSSVSGPFISVGIFQTKIAGPFWQTGSLPYLGNSEKVQMARAIPVAWPGLIGKCHSTFLGYFH